MKLRPEPDYHGRTELVLRPVWVSWAGQLEYGEMGPRYLYGVMKSFKF